MIHNPAPWIPSSSLGLRPFVVHATTSRPEHKTSGGGTGSDSSQRRRISGMWCHHAVIILYDPSRVVAAVIRSLRPRRWSTILFGSNKHWGKRNHLYFSRHFLQCLLVVLQLLPLYLWWSVEQLHRLLRFYFCPTSSSMFLQTCFLNQSTSSWRLQSVLLLKLYFS